MPSLAKMVGIYCTVGILALFLCMCVISKDVTSEPLPDASKQWPTRQINIIRSAYLGSDGMPSHEVFLQNHGLYPTQTATELRPYFSIGFLLSEIRETDGQLMPRESAESVSLDFFIETVTRSDAASIAKPIWDGRVYEDDGKLVVGGYSSDFNERPVGMVDDTGSFVPQLGADMAGSFPLLQIPTEQILFDPFEWKLLQVVPSNGEATENITRSFLPIRLYGFDGTPLDGVRFALEYLPGEASAALYGVSASQRIEIARCSLRKAGVVDRRKGYQPMLVEGCSQPASGKVMTFSFEGRFSQDVTQDRGILQIADLTEEVAATARAPQRQQIAIDGVFDDWRNVRGVGDPEGDFVSYLYPNPDTDLLEFKVTNDDGHLYLYSRVAGAHGRTGSRGRYYWYTYIDVDANPLTGYPPTRDDNCYFGVAIGDDCEAQFEFVGNRFVKTFFGFTGAGAEERVLDGQLSLGPSYYSSTDRQGNKRDRYKVEYVNREGSRFITHDRTQGTSEDIIMALSPDGSEMEMRVEFSGFLQDESGSPLMELGTSINVCIGAEAASDRYGSDDWGADSSPVIYGYQNR